MIKSILKNEIMSHFKNQMDFKFLKNFSDNIYLDFEKVTRYKNRNVYKNVILNFKNNCDNWYFGKIEIDKVILNYDNQQIKNLEIKELTTYIIYYNDKNNLIKCVI